ncbi:STAS domain-containing protein [Streptomyces sp. NPDC048191]|uniref:STAS domain-containing protein n=1 Tax=Streptomyces sp. NPDC048191 TaxID=3155484 RepID=UPI0033FC2FF1
MFTLTITTHPVSASSAAPVHGRHALVVVSGELDVATAPRLQAVLRDCAERGEHISMDLGRVRFIDGAGLRPLADADTRARRQGRRFTIVSAARPVRRVMGLTDLRHLVQPAVTT